MAEKDIKKQEEAKQKAEEAKQKQQAEEEKLRQEQEKTAKSSVGISEEARKKATSTSTDGMSPKGRGGEGDSPSQKEAKVSWSTTTDPYASSIRNRSFRQGIEANEAREIRRIGGENLKRDADYLRGALKLEGRFGEKASPEQIIKSLEQQTGIKAGAGTQGLGGYSDRDLAGYLNNPQVKTFVDNLKTGTGQLKEIAPQQVAPKPGEPGYRTDFQQRVAQIQTSKGARMDTAKGPNVVDPLRPAGSMVEKTGLVNKPGMYSPSLGIEGSLQYAKYGNIPTNKPATSVPELKERMAKFEQAGAEGRANDLARSMKPKGATIGGTFIPNQPKTMGGETEDQRIARREKELGIGRFASKSYFDDQSRGRRI